MTSSATTLENYPRLTASEIRKSALVQIHTSTEPRLREILASIPGYIQTRSALRTALDYTVAQVPPVPALAAATDVLIEAAMSGRPLSDALADLPDIGPVPVYEGRDYQLGILLVVNPAEVLRARVGAQALDGARDGLMSQLDGILVGNAALILGGISEGLVALVAEARKVLTDRGRIADAEDAIRQDRVAEWQASAALGAEYVELRRLAAYWSAKAGGMAKTFTGLPDQYVGYVRNPQDAHEDFSRIITGHEYRDVQDEKAFQAGGSYRLSWPSSWTEADAVWWFAQHPEVEPWAPTGAQVDRLGDELARLHRKHSRGGGRRAVQIVEGAA